jgi:S-adenosylmethionine hydrolase
MPVGVHLAVIDPGVGGSRRPLALRDAEGRLYVGPDNGLLIPAAERFGGIEEAHELANPDYALQPVSRTFHGRDLFAPAAAHLARGLDLGELGPPVAAETLARLDIPQPEIGDGHARAAVLYVDRYGNVQLNLDREHMDEVEISPGTRVELECKGERYYAVAARTFADARPGDILLYEDSYRNIAIAINGGSAAEMLAARAGDRVALRRVL